MSFGLFFVALNVGALVLTWFVWKKKIRLPHLVRLAYLFLYVLYLLSFILVEGYILHSSQSDTVKNHDSIDYVVILGAGLRGTEPSKTLEGRLVSAINYLNEHPDTPVIVSGGQGTEERISEAEAMRLYLVKHGIDRNRVILEDASTSTYENLKFTKALLEEKGVTDPSLLIVTSDYHLARSKMIARHFGLSCKGLAGDSPFFVKVNYYFREYVGMLDTSYQLWRD